VALVANSIVGLAQLGNTVGFIGKISDDEFGIKYEEGLKSERVEYLYSKKKEGTSNGNLFNINYSRLRANNVHISRDRRKD
jgi:sugar/nucleoside kinase (ribokinase family)